MRTKDERIIESAYKKVYVKENTNIEEPALVWVTKRLGLNLSQDQPVKKLLLALVKKIINLEQKKKTPKVPLSTAQVPITPDSFPASSIKKESAEILEAAKQYLREAEEKGEIDPNLDPNAEEMEKNNKSQHLSDRKYELFSRFLILTSPGRKITSEESSELLKIWNEASEITYHLGTQLGRALQKQGLSWRGH